jgi:hypothetical protein
MYEVEYTMEGTRLNIKFDEEKIVRPPSFNAPPGDAKISMDKE